MSTAADLPLLPDGSVATETPGPAARAAGPGRVVVPLHRRRRDVGVTLSIPLPCDDDSATSHPAPLDGYAAHEVLAFLSRLLSDGGSTLTEHQQGEAHRELHELVSDACAEAARLDPHCPVVHLPGRAAVAALRIVLSRGLIRDEWDT